MKGLKIDAIHVYNDPRDWGLDITIIVDLLLSRQGYLGTISPLNNNPTLPNSGYQQDGQPKLFISNPDLWWASDYPLSRLGQGGFHAALAGVWAAVTRGADLQQVMLGKPHQGAYQFAENRLSFLRQKAFDGVKSLPSLKDVYMIGDNPGTCYIALVLLQVCLTFPNRVRHSWRKLLQERSWQQMVFDTVSNRRI